MSLPVRNRPAMLRPRQSASQTTRNRWPGVARASAWLPDRLREAYVSVKQAELAATAELSLEERCARYAEVY